MGEAKRKRWASIEGPGAEKVKALPDGEQDDLHEIAVMAAQAAHAQMSLLAAQAQAMHGQGVNAAMSGALHGITKFAWQVRTPGMTVPQVAALLERAIKHALAQAERAELMGGPVAGNG